METKLEKLLMCETNAINYDLETRTGYIELPPMNCTDMSGAIALFKLIDPRVQRIFAGDMFYIRFGDEWAASESRNPYDPGVHHVRIEHGFSDCCREKKDPPPFVVGDVVRFKKGACNISGKQTKGTVAEADEDSVSFISAEGDYCDAMNYQIEMVKPIGGAK